MGCSCSKVHDQRPVALCRRRTDLLAAAIRGRFALAAAHSAYSDSLLSFSDALHRLILAPIDSSSSPVLRLPSSRKLSSPSPPPPPPSVSVEHPSLSCPSSDSGSHIHFLASDDSDEEDINLNTGYVYRSRRQPPPSSTSIQPQPTSYEIFSFSSSSSSFDRRSYKAGSSRSYAYEDSFFSANYDGYLGTSPSLPTLPPVTTHSPTKLPTWDFLNPFRSEESYYTNYDSYLPGRSSKDVREEEGIPDLEEDVPEVARNASMDRKITPSFTPKVVDEQPPRPVADGRTSGHELDDNVVEKKKACHDDLQLQLPKEKNDVASAPRLEDDSAAAAAAAATAIKEHFEMGCRSAKELSVLLEVGKKQYRSRHSLYEVSSAVVEAVASPIIFRRDGYLLEVDEEEKVMSVGSIASTLQKLYVWERKLYHEVKAEEKMRWHLSRSLKQLRQLDKRGAEAGKIDSTRSLIKKLSMKIKISIQVASSISKKIDKLRDEELWPQISELFIGLSRMWCVMLECHQIQLKAISEVEFIDSTVTEGKLGDIYINKVIRLELELINWKEKFSNWIDAQRNYVKALNGWLALGLNNEPRKKVDVLPPHFPRIGAPPLFMISYYWSQAINQISQTEVLESMDFFGAFLCGLRTNNKDTKRLLKAAENNNAQEVKMELSFLSNKTDIYLSKQANDKHKSNMDEVITLQSGLRQVFLSMERFMASSIKAYDDVRKHVEEDIL